MTDTSAVTDTYVDAASPTTNFNGATRLRVSHPTKSWALMTFKVPAGSVTGVKLRVYAPVAGRIGVTVREGSCSYSSASVTWNSRPPMGIRIASNTSFAAGGTDITLPVGSVKAGGTNCLQLTKSSDGTVSLDSIESGYPARLLVTYAASTPPPPPPPPPPPERNCITSGVTWCGDFSTGNASTYTQILARPTSLITFPKSAAAHDANRRYVARFQLGPKDTWTDGTNRVQLREARAFACGGQSCWREGADVYYHVDMYIDPSTTITASLSNPWRLLFSWPTTENGNCSNGGFGVNGINPANGNIVANGTPALEMTGTDCGSVRKAYWWLLNPVKGAWYDFIVHRRYSSNASVGFQEFWLKKPGETAYTKQALNGPAGGGAQRVYFATLGCANCHANMRLGIYRHLGFTTTDVIYYANVRSTTRFAAAQ